MLLWGSFYLPLLPSTPSMKFDRGQPIFKLCCHVDPPSPFPPPPLPAKHFLLLFLMPFLVNYLLLFLLEREPPRLLSFSSDPLSLKKIPLILPFLFFFSLAFPFILVTLTVSFNLAGFRRLRVFLYPKNFEVIPPSTNFSVDLLLSMWSEIPAKNVVGLSPLRSLSPFLPFLYSIFSAPN